MEQSIPKSTHAYVESEKTTKSPSEVVNPGYATVTICKEVSNPLAVQSFLEFRKRFFVDALGWSLTTFGDLERDEFDTENAVYCVVRINNETIGGWRAIPTSCPYLSQSIFNELADTGLYPNSDDAWEISRFGLIKSQENTRIPNGLLYALMFQFAVTHSATTLVAIADLFHERLLKRLRIVTTRYGPPAIVGYARDGFPIEVVAGEIPIFDQDKALIKKLLAITSKVEITDETLVLGLERISA